LEDFQVKVLKQPPYSLIWPIRTTAPFQTLGNTASEESSSIEEATLAVNMWFAAQQQQKNVLGGVEEVRT
jgi:hypothetical protein